MMMSLGWEGDRGFDPAEDKYLIGYSVFKTGHLGLERKLE